jgi:hypothetical protein
MTTRYQTSLLRRASPKQTMEEMMRKAGTFTVSAAVVAILLVPSLAFSQNAITAPASKTIGAAKQEMVPSLIVMNARGASLQGTNLILNGVSPNSIVFADRPVRAAGHALTAHLLEEWTPNPDGGDSFAKDPPNATISVLSKDGANVRDAVVVLKNPKLAGDQLTFDVQVLEGDLAGADGPASIFIDIIGRPLTPLSFAGVARRTAYRSAWYRGAAVAGGAALAGAAVAGAAYRAAAAPYYYPPPAYYGAAPAACGYYPYPPCY